MLAKKIFAVFAFLLMMPSVLAYQAFVVPNVVNGSNETGNATGMEHKEEAMERKEGNVTSENRGKGLLNAIAHVPAAIAEKFKQMLNWFSEGLKGIGQALSDFIKSLFGGNKEKNMTANMP